MRLDLNCDLGEGEPIGRTRVLMRWITSANVACGGHAGNLKAMEACVRLARQQGVRLGAHPGPWSRGDFERGQVQVEPDELELLLLHQIGALERLARANGLPLHHVKLHGALYHASELNDALAKRYVVVVKRFWPRAKIYACAAGRVARIARRAGVVVWEEAFADRGYQDDGTLVSRNEPNALLTGKNFVVGRIRGLLEKGEIIAGSGKRITLRPQTLCIHSDTPHAPQLARAAAKELQAFSRPTNDGRETTGPIRGHV